MKARFVIISAFVLIGVVAAISQVGVVPSAVAGDEVVVASAAMTVVPAGSDDAEFVSSRKCKKCHIKEYKSWEDTKKAKTFDLLKPGEAVEAKKKANLDPEKDYTKDTSCLKCHTTGFGHPGGYMVPDPADEKAVKEASRLEGVGCESCHGAGSAYMELHEEIKKSKRTYKVDEMHAAGLAKIDAAACTSCHNEESPTYKPFDFEQQKNKGSHEVFPLKQREQ
jgi:hypothetical protein